LAVAVANALANEEIRKLRDQLEEENIVLREQLRRVQIECSGQINHGGNWDHGEEQD
jgi:hypothetical protein